MNKDQAARVLRNTRALALRTGQDQTIVRNSVKVRVCPNVSGKSVRYVVNATKRSKAEAISFLVEA